MASNQKYKLECVVHYKHLHVADAILPLTAHKFTVLQSNVLARRQVGGDYEHAEQCATIPEDFNESKHGTHNTCYKKFTMATSIARKRGIEFGKEADNGEVGPSPKQRSRRSGEGKTTLFPNYCMFFKKKDPIKVNYKKQWPHKLECEGVEKRLFMQQMIKMLLLCRCTFKDRNCLNENLNVMTSVTETTPDLYMKPLVMKASHI